MTGTGDNTQVYGKLVELLKETVPSMLLVAYLRNPDTPGTDQQMARSRDAATQLGLTFLEVQVRAPEQVHAAIASAVAEHADGIVISADTVFSLATQPNPVLTDTIAYHLPMMYSQVTGYVDHGGLMAFSPDFVASQRRAADYVDKTLRGARPPSGTSDALPVCDQPEHRGRNRPHDSAIRPAAGDSGDQMYSRVMVRGS